MFKESVKISASCCMKQFIQAEVWLSQAPSFHCQPLLLLPTAQSFGQVASLQRHEPPFKVRPSGLGSCFSYIKLVLEVLCLAVKCHLPKLVKFCEELVERKITLTTANSQQVLILPMLITIVMLFCMIVPFTLLPPTMLRCKVSCPPTRM